MMIDQTKSQASNKLFPPAKKAWLKPAQEFETIIMARNGYTAKAANDENEHQQEKPVGR